jgi:dTDP-4-amino-4,6-dideoxygalactose transaminase
MHATKLLAAGEGGIFISNNLEWVSRFKSWSNFGMLGNGDRTSYTLGINAKLSEYAAAVALASLEMWPRTREKVLNQSANAIALANSFGLPVSTAMKKGYATPYWIVSLSNANTKARLQNQLKNDAISYRNWWESGCHCMPAFEKVHHDQLDNTERLSNTTVGLPFHCFLTESDWQRISKSLAAINEFN